MGSALTQFTGSDLLDSRGLGSPDELLFSTKPWYVSYVCWSWLWDILYGTKHKEICRTRTYFTTKILHFTNFTYNILKWFNQGERNYYPIWTTHNPLGQSFFFFFFFFAKFVWNPTMCLKEKDTNVKNFSLGHPSSTFIPHPPPPPPPPIKQCHPLHITWHINKYKQVLLFLLIHVYELAKLFLDLEKIHSQF